MTAQPWHTSTSDRILVAAADAARLLSIGESTLWRKVAAHELPQPVKIAGMTRWRVADLMRYVDGLSNQQTTA